MVVAHGATLIFYFGFGVVISNSRNITVRGLTLDSDPSNYAQGTVVGGSARNSSLVAQFDAAFIPPDTRVQPFSHAGGLMGAKVMFWDPATRLPLRGSLNFMAGSSKHAGGDSWLIDLKNPFVDHATGVAPPVGSLLTVFARRGITWQVTNSSRLLTEDLTIHAGGNMGVHENYGGGGHIYRRLSIVRKPGSKGLMALNVRSLTHHPATHADSC